MEANYQVLKDTLFGRLLGCALPQIIKNKLVADASAEVDLTKLDININVDGVDLDIHKLFSVFERSLKDIPMGLNTNPQGIDTGALGLTDLIDMLETLSSELSDKQEYVGSECSDAINAASSEYFCGEYASEAASESGNEHHPGSEFLYEQIERIDSLVSTLKDVERSSAAA